MLYCRNSFRTATQKKTAPSQKAEIAHSSLSNTPMPKRFGYKWITYLVMATFCLSILANCGRGSDEPEAPNTAEEAAVEPTQAVVEETDDDASDDADAADAGNEESAETNVYFELPENDATVSTTFSVVMSAEGVSVDPAGDILENSGHMHILVDTDFIETGSVIPKDEQHIHFGDGQTTAELTLSPGEHTLRLQLADGAHIAMDGEEYRDEITVMVEETSAETKDDADKEDADADQEASAMAASDESDERRDPEDLWTSMACSACHSLKENQTADNVGQPGPHMGNISETAATRVADQSAAEYLTASIVAPNEYINEGYFPNIMPQNFADQMSEQEIDDMVVWLLESY